MTTPGLSSNLMCLSSWTSCSELKQTHNNSNMYLYLDIWMHVLPLPLFSPSLPLFISPLSSYLHIYLSVHLLSACISVWVFTQIYMYIYIYLCIHTHCMHDSPYLVIPGTAPTVHTLLLFKLLMRLLFPTLGRPATMSTQHRYNVHVRTTYLQILYEPLVQCL